MQYGSAGAGSATHVTCVLLNVAIGVDVTHVPYRGTGPAMQDLMGGRIDYICDVISTALPLIRSKIGEGDRAALATTQQRAAGSRNRRRSRASRVSTPMAGTRSSCPAARPSRSCAASPRRRATRSTLPGCASASRAWASTSPPPERRTPEYLAKLVPSELVKWADAVKASGAAGTD